MLTRDVWRDCIGKNLCAITVSRLRCVSRTFRDLFTRHRELTKWKKRFAIRAANKNLGKAAKKGDTHLVNLAIQYGAIDWDYGLRKAFTGGHEDIAEMMIQRGASIPIALQGACRGGHMELYNKYRALCTDRSYRNYELQSACRGRNVKLVEQLLQERDLSLSMALGAAGREGNTNLIQKLTDMLTPPGLGPGSMSNLFYGACRGGHIEMLQNLIKTHGFGQCDVEHAVHLAYVGGHLNIIKLLLQHYSLSLTPGVRSKIHLYSACLGGHPELIKFTIEEVNDIDMDSGLEGACVGGRIDIMQQMLEKGADPNAGLLGAIRCGHVDIIIRLIKAGATDLDYAFEHASRFYGSHLLLDQTKAKLRELGLP